MRYSFAVLFISSTILVACGGGNVVSPAVNDRPLSATDAVSVASGSSALKFFSVGTNAQRDAYGFDIVAHTDGNIYYSTLGPLLCNPGGVCTAKPGNAGRLDPATGAFTELPLTGAPFGLTFTPDGALWAAELWSGRLARILPFTSTGAKEIVLPPAPSGTPGPRALTYGPDGHVWFTDFNARRIGKLNASGPYTSSAVTTYPVPNGPPGTIGIKPRPFGITTGSDGNIWFTDRINGVVYRSTTGGIMTPFITPETKALGGNDTSTPSYLARGSDNLLYLTQTGSSTGNHGFFDRLTTAGAFTQLPLAPGGLPYLAQAGKDLVAFTDLGNSAIGIYNTSTRRFVEIPTTPILNSGRHSPNGVTVASDGSLWFTCYGPVTSGALCVGHLVLGAVWSVFPGTSITVGHGANASPQLIGIAETGNSGPFTATSSKAAVAKVAPVTGEDHNFVITGEAPGNATITLKDAHGRVVALLIKVQ
ncbi:MAG: hypothetical protein JO322_00475 [Candidatus Eremiobacteraeota bacterium]|nr:hypothetical protein [Candidatus Eremiobacteraeota bacterium]